MATNADTDAKASPDAQASKDADASATDDGKPVTEADLRADKYKEEVETPNGEDETSDDSEAEEPKEADEKKGKKPQSSSEESEETDKTESAEETSFVKEFPNIKGDTPEEYARNLEEAYKNSTSEALRLKKEKEVVEAAHPTAEDDSENPDPRLLYVDGVVKRDAAQTFEDFRKEYPQADDEAEYEKFVTEVAQLSRYILETQHRAALASELYPKAAAMLGWQRQTVDDTDRLATAVKETASSSKTVSATKKTAKSKVSDAMIAGHRRMYPNDSRSDAAIREELEPYIQ